MKTHLIIKDPCFKYVLLHLICGKTATNVL